MMCAILAALSVAVLAPSHADASDDTIVAKINGKVVTEGDLKLAEADLGSELAPLPEPTKRQLLLEFMIETISFSDAAEAAGLDKGQAFEARLAYLKRRALRDGYFEAKIKSSVTDADAKKFYDDQVKAIKPQDEVSARHILVEKRELADQIVAKLKAGGDFAALAKEHSKDPGSKDGGGDLGFFGRGQMVPPFEEAAFALAKPNDLSAPVQSQFGWHIIQLVDKRTRQAPAFEAVKDRILNSLVGDKAQVVATELRAKANVEVIDPVLRKAMEPKAADTPAKKN
jgi:peptidyl-prolyl cis-trans isomerase C